jgi:hypothetical protein
MPIPAYNPLGITPLLLSSKAILKETTGAFIF